MELKISKKHIVIVIVALVAVWLLWKKGLFSKLKASTSGTSAPATGDASIDLDYILSHVVMDGRERNAINTFAEKCKTNAETRQNIQAKAYKNGVSFDQQVAFDAIWMLYHEYSDGKWSNGWTSERGWQLIAEIKKL